MTCDSKINLTCFCHYKKFQIQSTSYKYIHPLHQVVHWSCGIIWFFILFITLLKNILKTCNKWQTKTMNLKDGSVFLFI